MSVDDLRLIVDLRQPFGADDLIGGAPGREHLLEHALGDRAADRPALDETDQVGQPLRRDGRRGDVLSPMR